MAFQRSNTTYSQLLSQTSVASAGSQTVTIDLTNAIDGTVYIKHDTLQTPDADTRVQVYQSYDGTNYADDDTPISDLTIDYNNDPDWLTVGLMGGRKYEIIVTNQDSTDARNITIESAVTPSFESV